VGLDLYTRSNVQMARYFYANQQFVDGLGNAIAT
jgi:hypothetical protein